MKIKLISFRTLLTLAAMCVSLCAMAQSSTLTPYSRYGYGMLNDNASSMQRAMGGVGYAMNSGRQINAMNPASYAAIDSITFLFDMGGNFKVANLKEDGSSETQLTGGLDYITMSFPLKRHIGASLGLLPYSTTGYNFSESITNGSSTHEGSGGISQVYAGLGINPVAGLYVGANISYMFGTTINDIYVSTGTNASVFERYMHVTDWKADFGLQYSLNLNKGRRLTLGLAYSPAKDFHGQTYGVYYDSSQDSKPDTVAPGEISLKGKYSMPATYGAGINMQWSDRLMTEVDFTYQPWKDAKYMPIEDFETSQFDNRWKVAAGLQYTPHPRGAYFQRVQYRFGGYYNHDYIMVHGNNVNEYGVTAGLSFPIPQFKTLVNLTFDYKHRQATPNPLLKEQYLTVTLGVNFNETWFYTRKLH